MYSHNLGLSQDPFSIAPDPRFLFMSERHREALAHLLYGVSAPDTGASTSGGAGGGFVLLTGEIGTGKTTICRGFLEQIPANCHVAYIFNPKLTVAELLQSICEEFHILAPANPVTDSGTEPSAAQGKSSPSLKQHIDALNAFLLSSHAAGHSCVLIIDEAQNLMPEVLEQLRLLTNLETNERKLLQIVLIGQPELRTMLQRPELEQLAQRVIARYHLNALNGAETGHYIAHRLSVAGHTGALPFDARAVARIHAITGGVPRRINLLCGRSLLGAWATGQQRVNRAVVDKAALEVFGPDALTGVPAAKGKTAWLVLTGLVVLGWVSALGYVVWQESKAPPPTAQRLPTKPPAPAAPATTGPPAAAKPAAPSTPTATATTAPGAVPAAPAAVASGSATDPAKPPVQPTPVDMDSLLPRLATQQATAWRALGGLWSLPAMAGNPCQTAALQPLQCVQTTKLTLPQLRQLGRPGILTLATNEQRPVYAVLVGLGAQTATLQVDGTTQVVKLSALGRLWQGDFATYWQAPAGFVPDPHDGSTGPAIDTLANLLARVEAKENNPPAGAASPPTPLADQRLDPALRMRVRAFQRTQGLMADGHPGPLTFMQLESALGLNHPRLLTE